MLITTLPQTEASQFDEVVALQQWVAEGNTLLILAALNDRLVGYEGRGGIIEGIGAMADIDVSRQADPDGELKPADVDVTEGTTALTDLVDETLAPTQTSPHPLTRAIGELNVARDPLAPQWIVSPYGPEPLLPVFSGTDTGAPAFWHRSFGDGMILLSGRASLFANSHVGTADNGALFRNVLRLGLGPQGQVVFDDYHQGLSDLYDPAAFYADPRLGKTVLIVLFLWLCWAMFSNRRLTISGNAAGTVRGADYIRATGGFYARTLAEPVIARRMFSHFFDDVAESLHSQPGIEPVWRALKDHPRVSNSSIRRLSSLHAMTESNRAVDLTRLHNLMNSIRTTIQ